MANRVDRPQTPQAQTLKRIRALTQVLDNAIAIPGTNYRIGLDPILGLLPGAGDAVGTVLSVYIVLEASRLGIPREMLVRMLGNILFETIVGSVPVLGDVVDATWKANLRNLTLLESHLGVPAVEVRQRPVNRGVAILLIVGFVILSVALIALTVMLIRWLFQAIGS